jgi:predicted protein tyrosine phosphatase
MKIFICSRIEVPDYIVKDNITHCLTLLRNDHRVKIIEDVVRKNNVNWKFVEFDDVNIPHNRAIVPNRQHVNEILQWYDTIPEDAHVLIHCEAGISRSSCCALALLVQGLGTDTWSITRAREAVVELRPFAHPNTLLAKHFDDALDCKGEFVNAVNYIRSQALR